MDFTKIDLTEVVDSMAAGAVGDEWGPLPADVKRDVRESMLHVLMPGCDAFEASVRAAVAAEIRAVARDRSRTRPLELGAQTSTDFADDFEWAAMIAEGSL